MDQALSSVRVSELIAALSAALDMTEGQPRGHAARTCLIGMRIGAELGLSEADRSALYYALLLKDAGCSSSSARMSELFDADDIELKSAGKLIDWAKSGDVTRYLARFSGPDGNAIARARRIFGAWKNRRNPRR